MLLTSQPLNLSNAYALKLLNADLLGFFLAGFMCSSLQVTSASETSVLTVNITEVGRTVELEVGRVAPSELRTLKVRIQNRTQEELTIRKMVVSCRCLTPVLSMTLLKPEEAADLSVSYKVTSMKALNDKQSIQFLDASGRRILEVVVKARVRAELSSTIEKIAWTDKDVVAKKAFRFLVCSFSKKTAIILVY